MASNDRPTLKAAALMFACFAAMAAGMVDLSISAGYLTGAGSATPGIMVAGGAALAAGLALLAWSLQGLHRNSVVYPRYLFPASATAAAAHVGALAWGMANSPRSLDVSHLAALGLTLMALAGAGWLRRQHTSNDGGAHAQPRTGRLLAAAFGAAVVVAAVATPGLAASMAGQHAVPHGEHSQTPPAGHSPDGSPGHRH
ncbi:hypothetical protein [Arthrobacter sp. CJ23]|uniref:hypothetical protein n=1 Tax=Arthrobacter sp. CJ23 TaxID=2972479 RepID=UPI00215D496D|nr:hypothetical protein [Arthrobacter sp. CJ23]UVJ40865.1 hypothetical protein NVV90_06780 [Arthrobacter sp. CJ23]